MSASKYKRRTYILKNTSQPKYIFSYFILFCTGMLLFSLLFSFMSIETTTITYADNQVSVGNTPYMLLKKMLGSGWIITALGGSLLFIISVLMTHRVAGPAYRINQSVKKMLEGRFGFKIILRKNDEFKPIAKNLENLSMLIAEKTDGLKNHKREFDEIIDNLDINIEDKDRLKQKNSEIDTYLKF